METITKILLVLLITIAVYSQEQTMILQEGFNGFSGCEDRSLFEKKLRTTSSNWGGTMAGTFPEMAVHGEEANDGECPKLAFGELLC